MRDSAKAAFFPLSKKFEGYLTFMYADVKNLVTTGMGNLIDPIQYALSLPWKDSSGNLVSQDTIRDAWNAVKARTDLNQRGGGSYRGVTSIRLDDAGIQQLINTKMTQNEAVLKSRYPAFDSWPADAQLALHLMAWALGPAFKYPKFMAAVNQTLPDFRTGAIESHISEAGNPGVIPRNIAIKALFNNAADVLANNLDPDTLVYDVNIAGGSAASSAASSLSQKKTPVKQAMTRGKIAGLLIAAGMGVVVIVDKVKGKRKR